MRKFWLVVLLMSVALLGGCAIMDAFMGIERDAEGNIVKESPVSPISFLGTIVPGLAGLTGAARWIYAEISRKKIDKNFKAIVAGVTDAVDKKAVSKDVLYPILTAASQIYANREFFAESVEKVKRAVRDGRKKA